MPDQSFSNDYNVQESLPLGADVCPSDGSTLTWFGGGPYFRCATYLHGYRIFGDSAGSIVYQPVADGVTSRLVLVVNETEAATETSPTVLGLTKVVNESEDLTETVVTVLT